MSIDFCILDLSVHNRVNTVVPTAYSKIRTALTAYTFDRKANTVSAAGSWISRRFIEATLTITENR